MMNIYKYRGGRLVLFFLICWIFSACASYPNDPRSPKTGDDSYTIEEDGFLIVNAEYGILSNDTPEEGEETILVTVGEQETENGGVAVLAVDGSFTYDPYDDFNGTDQLAYVIKNNKGKETSGIIYIEVTPVNDSPQAADDVLYNPISEPTIINVLENDDDPEGDDFSLIAVGTPDSGTAVDNGDGTILYTPASGHSGPVRFSYTVADVFGASVDAWVSLIVIDSENSIVMEPDTMTVTEDTSGAVSADQLTVNDHDLFEGELTVIAVGDAQNGFVELIGDSITYTPNADFFGTDSFNYTVESEQGYTASTTVTVDVLAVNDPPTISQIESQTVQAGSLTDPIVFSIEDLDNPFEELTVRTEITSCNPAGLINEGNIYLNGRNADRIIQIVTQPDISGIASINVMVSDGQATTTESFTLVVLVGPPAPSEFYRYYNATLGNHYYTTDWSELGSGRGGYVYEGVQCHIYLFQFSGTVPLHRYYSDFSNDHFYTIERNDQVLSSLGYGYERVAGYVFSYPGEGTIPMFGYFNDEAGDHFYTTNYNEMGNGRSGYVYEGVQFYVMSSPT